MPSTLEELGSALVMSQEGDKTKAYRDSGGVWTIGIGHTGPDVHEGLAWNEDQIAAAFIHDAAPLFAAVHKFVVMPAQGAGYVSFGFNCGLTAMLHAHDGTVSILNFVHDRHGKIVDDLVRRRKLEYYLVNAA